MPSNKHKKKKKSHKRSKRRSSSSSVNSSNSPWRVNFSDEDSDELSNQERLTTLVRRTYRNYLKQALTLNFEDYLKNSSELDLESVEEIVQKWSSVLEQKAMRTCMVSELYRTSMVSLIRQIKASTNDKKLYIKDKSLSKLKSKVPMNNGSQTDPMDCKEMETQTDFQMPSLLELPLPVLSHSSIPYDPAIEFSDSDCSNVGVSSSISSKQTQPNSVICGNQDICNISSTSDLLDAVEPSTGENRVNELSVQNSLWEENASNISTLVCSSAVSANGNNTDIGIINSSNNEIKNSKTVCTLMKKRTSVENDPPSVINNLDQRLSALGLLVDNSEDNVCQPLEKTKRSNWYAEETAQSCNLTRILMRMTTKQRERVLKKIKDLFGEENGPMTELSEENVNICRKRIASVVVMELTPVYQAKRIASRHLFKYLAKKITRSIMEKSLAPDTRSIRWRVKKYFEDGKIIMSESDCI